MDETCRRIIRLVPDTKLHMHILGPWRSSVNLRLGSLSASLSSTWMALAFPYFERKQAWRSGFTTPDLHELVVCAAQRAYL
jgi:hypothetical protein